jgi:hypothetical protein
MSKVFLNDIGEVRVSKDGKSSYIVFTKDVTLEAGTILNTRTVEEKFMSLVEKGLMELDKAQERIEKTPDFIVKFVSAVYDSESVTTKNIQKSAEAREVYKKQNDNQRRVSKAK